VDPSAGTLGAFYYSHIRNAAFPSRDHVSAPGQDEKFTVAEFDRQAYAYAVGMLEGLGLKAGHKLATWMTNELEHVVVQYAAGLLGLTVVVVDPAVSFDGLLTVLKEEGVRTLFMSPRYAGEDRLGALGTVFEPEIMPNHQNTFGVETFDSKRLRMFKHIVCTSKEFKEGVLRFRDLPVYGASEKRREPRRSREGEGLPASSDIS